MQGDHLRDTLSRDRSSDRDACLGRACSGDGRAFAMLVEQLSPSIERSLVRFLRSDAEAASAAMQDAWTAASQRLTDFESTEHLVCWLHRVAKCKAISGLRKIRRLVTSSWEEPSGDSHGFPLPAAPLEESPDREGRDAIRQAVACLPDAYRGIATLYYLHGQEIREVARLGNLSVGTVKMRLHRARVRLRRRLRNIAPS